MSRLEFFFSPHPLSGELEDFLCNPTSTYNHSGHNSRVNTVSEPECHNFPIIIPPSIGGRCYIVEP